MELEGVAAALGGGGVGGDVGEHEGGMWEGSGGSTTWSESSNGGDEGAKGQLL